MKFEGLVEYLARVACSGSKEHSTSALGILTQVQHIESALNQARSFIDYSTVTLTVEWCAAFGRQSRAAHSSSQQQSNAGRTVSTARDSWP